MTRSVGTPLADTAVLEELLPDADGLGDDAGPLPDADGPGDDADPLTEADGPGDDAEPLTEADGPADDADPLAVGAEEVGPDCTGPD